MVPGGKARLNEEVEANKMRACACQVANVQTLPPRPCRLRRRHCRRPPLIHRQACHGAFGGADAGLPPWRCRRRRHPSGTGACRPWAVRTGACRPWAVRTGACPHWAEPRRTAGFLTCQRLKAKAAGYLRLRRCQWIWTCLPTEAKACAPQYRPVRHGPAVGEGALYFSCEANIGSR